MEMYKGNLVGTGKTAEEYKDIEFIEGYEELLDEVSALWERLNEHHKSNSIHFKEKYDKFTFEDRRKGFLEKAKEAKLKIYLAKDKSTDTFIGYSICTITKDLIGELESLYVEAAYRKYGLGDKLITSALSWMKENHTKSITIGVAAGNEQAFKFYERYGFYPSVTLLKEKNI